MVEGTQCVFDCSAWAFLLAAGRPTPAFSGADGDLHRPARATVRHEAKRSRPGQEAAPAASTARNVERCGVSDWLSAFPDINLL